MWTLISSNQIIWDWSRSSKLRRLFKINKSSLVRHRYILTHNLLMWIPITICLVSCCSHLLAACMPSSNLLCISLILSCRSFLEVSSIYSSSLLRLFSFLLMGMEFIEAVRGRDGFCKAVYFDWLQLARVVCCIWSAPFWVPSWFLLSICSFTTQESRIGSSELELFWGRDNWTFSFSGQGADEFNTT